MNKAIKVFMVIFAIMLLGSCGVDNRQQKAKEYLQAVKAKPPGEVEPLPIIKPYEGYKYAAQSLRSPFKVPQPLATVVDNSSNNGIQPDANRPREELEAYPLDSLRMLGILEKDDKKWAILKDPKGTVHRITIGNYIGLNHGKVIEVFPEQLKIMQLIADGNGGWKEVEAIITLVE